MAKVNSLVDSVTNLHASDFADVSAPAAAAKLPPGGGFPARLQLPGMGDPGGPSDQIPPA